MKNLLFPLCVSALVISSCQKEANDKSFSHPNNVNHTTNLVESTSENDRIIEDEYIIQLQPEFLSDLLPANAAYSMKLRLAHNAFKGILSSVTDGNNIEIQRVFVNVLTGFSAQLTAQQATEIRSLALVKSIDNNVVLSLNDTKMNSTVQAQTNSASTQVVGYGPLRTGYGDGTGKRAYILDSGIDLDHEDLNVNTQLGRDFTGNGGFFGGGGLFGGSSSGPEGDDDNGHGTHCAGIVAAIDNNVGIVGVAANAEVIAIKCFNFLGNGHGDDVIQGIDYISSIATPGEAVNMSFGFAYGYSPLDAATLDLASQGILIAAAAGNDSRNTDMATPGKLNAPNFYTISAMDENDVYASFSNFGNPPIDFCAPGVDIYSTYTNNGYSTLSGTSMATPHVVGLLLLNGTNINTDGFVLSDPDGTADPIAHL